MTTDHDELLARIEKLEASVFPREFKIGYVSDDGNYKWAVEGWVNIYPMWQGKPLKTKEDWDAMYSNPLYQAIEKAGDG